MCDYCEGEGCICGADSQGKYSSPCECGVQGASKCANCGCTAKPWWLDLALPDAVRDLLTDLNSDQAFFPATKEKLIQALPEDDGGWLTANLPNASYRDTGEVAAALIGKMQPVAWQASDPTKLLWKYPATTLAQGQELIVTQDQTAVLVSRSGKSCDEFASGRYTVSSTTCPLLLSNSREVMPGFQHIVFDGSPVFLLKSKEFEITPRAMGQSKSLRRLMANGVARVRISDPKAFLEHLGPKANYTSEGMLTGLQKYAEDVVKQEMPTHELDELASNHSILENALSAGLSGIGLEPLKVSFSYVGEPGPGMYAQGVMQMRANAQSAEEMKQWAESMKATQAARLQAIQQMQQQMQSVRQQVAASRAGTANAQIASKGMQTVRCSSCNAENPQTSKFCGNCGKPLETKKTCPKCGQQSDSGIKFCGNCGTKL